MTAIRTAAWLLPGLCLGLVAASAPATSTAQGIGAATAATSLPVPGLLGADTNGGSGTDPFAPLEFLIGGTWITEYRGPDGEAVTERARYERTANGTAVRFTAVEVVGGEVRPHVAGLWTWHPGEERFAYLSAGRDGTLQDGAGTWDGQHLAVRTDLYGPDGTHRIYRFTLTPVDEATVDFDLDLRRNGEWTDVHDLTYRRTPDSVPGADPGR